MRYTKEIWHSGEEIMRGERRPGHAGPLAGWERVAIVALLAIMVGLVVLLTISAARARADHPRPGHGRDGAVTGRARARPATRRTPAP